MMSTTRQLAYFISVGGVALLVLLSVTYILADRLGLWYFWAYLVGALCSWTFIFFANSLLTFQGHKKDHYAMRYGVFIGMYLCVFGVHAAIVYSLTSLFGVPHLISIVVATVITTIITFISSKQFIFTYANTKNH